MAVIEEGLYSYLSTFAGLVSLVSTRVYPDFVPQDATMPCLAYKRISTPRELSHDTSGIGADLAHPRFQFNAWATTKSSAKAINEQVRAALNGKRGTIATGVSINSSLVVDERYRYEPETQLHTYESDFIIWHND